MSTCCKWDEISIMEGIRVLWTAAILLLVANIAFGNEVQKCIKGKYHKVKPSPENNQFKECHPWKSLTCCTAAFTADLAANQTRNLYNHSWHRCKELSKSCERYWIEQECFYQCSPYVAKWQDKDFKEGVKGLPICASVCDRWYEACKYDEICVENVLSDYNFTEHGENFCPANKPCKTYEEMYGSGKAMCEKMWKPSYRYVKENRDSSNCMVMWFQGTNPNSRVKFDGFNSGRKLSASFVHGFSLAIFGALLSFYSL